MSLKKMEKNLKKQKRENFLFCQKGMIFIDVIYAFTLAFFLLFLFVIFAFVLSVTEISQYISFAGSRNYLASHHTEEDQRDLALRKVDLLLNNRAVRSFFRENSWFRIENIEAGLREDFEGSDVSATDSRDIFRGLWFTLSVPILNFNIPFLGSTDSDNEGFQTEVRSFLGREISQAECQEFDLSRWEAIRTQFSSSGLIPENVPLSYEDNGC